MTVVETGHPTEYVPEPLVQERTAEFAPAVGASAVNHAEVEVAATHEVSESSAQTEPKESRKRTKPEEPPKLSWEEMTPQQRLATSVGRFAFSSELSRSEIQQRNARRVLTGQDAESPFKRAAGRYPPGFRR